MKDRDAYIKILKARTSLVINHPFFASLALRLKVREDYSCETAWTDGHVFGYNPRYIRHLSSEKLEGLAAHTVMHPACGHHNRRNKREPNTWNRACDYAVNGILIDAGFVLPDGYLFSRDYDGKSAETVYDIILEGGDDSEPEENESAADDSGAIDEIVDDKTSAKSGSSENSEESSEDATSSSDPGKSGEVRDNPSDGTDNDPDTETDWDEALVQAFVNARGMGKLPDSVERFIDRRINPKLNWQTLLARFIERSARSDYSWVTPNRRYIHRDLYLPSLQNHDLNEIIIAIDTSGSITSEELEQFSAELSEIMNNYPATLHLIYCDAAVSDYQVFNRSDLPVTIRPVGGGGTDFRPVFEMVYKKGLMPSCLIYLTDLESLYYPDNRPSFPVLWIKTGNSDRQPPFGEVINL